MHTSSSEREFDDKISHLQYETLLRSSKHTEAGYKRGRKISALKHAAQEKKAHIRRAQRH
jgi:hypothetical protein